jgi:hypothetical protein
MIPPAGSLTAMPMHGFGDPPPQGTQNAVPEQLTLHIMRKTICDSDASCPRVHRQDDGGTRRTGGVTPRCNGVDVRTHR